MKIKLCSVFLLCILLLTSCTPGTKESGEESKSSINSNGKHTDSDHSGSGEKQNNEVLNKNPLTGLYDLESDAVGQRPVVIMLNNIKRALPQSGISQPDLYFESETEGGITRIATAFADKNKVPTIGSVRSARPYFIQFATSIDAIYVHFGGCKYAYDLLKQNPSIDHIDGMSGTSTFWRDKEMIKAKGLEYSAYTKGENILKGISQYKLRTKSKSGAQPEIFHFLDNKVRTPSELSASEVTIPISGAITAAFKYNTEDSLYYREQFGQKHIDATNQKQVAVSNVVILYTNYTALGDGRVSASMSGGKGLYISKGGAQTINWEKAGSLGAFSFKDQSGADLTVNQGKTWIIMMRDTRANLVKFK